jgi:maltose/moltooligosaccharide transporter
MSPQNTKLNFGRKQIFNLNLGPFGTTLVFALIYANVNGIFILLGAANNQLPMLWLLPSIIGFIIPPIMGYISDKTHTAWGKRLPYIFFGTIGAVISIFLLPISPSLFWAGLGLCLFIFCINIAFQLYRPLVVDLVPANLHTKLYALQTAIGGIGAILATASPWLFSQIFKSTSHAAATVPLPVRLAFYVSGLVLMLATTWTVITCKKYLPVAARPIKIQHKQTNISAKVKNFLLIFTQMSKTMWLISAIQFTTWIGVFCFIIYLTTAIHQTIFNNASDPSIIEKSITLTGLSSSIYMAANIVFAYCISWLAKVIKAKSILMFALVVGGLALISLQFIHQPSYLLIAMIGFGITWAGFNSIPFAIVASAVPKEKMGLYMGVFNMAICLPQIIVSLFAGLVLKSIFGNNALALMTAAGICLIAAGLLTLFLNDN